MKYIEVDGVEGLVEVPDDITDEQILDVGEKLTQGRVQSAAGAMMREGGSMWGKAAQGVARGGQVLRESPIMWTPGRGVYVDKAQKERLSEVTGKEKQKELESDPLYQFGENLAAGAQEAFPTNPLYADKLETAVASGLGSVMALAPSALAGPAAPLVAGGGYGMSAGESGAEDAQAILDSRIQAALEQGDINTAAQLEQDKFSIETAAFLLNAPIGAATEGILGVAGRWAGMARGKGGVLGGLTDKLVGSMAKSQKVKRGAEGFVSESLQEGLEQGAGNEVAKVLYDPDRKLTQGVGMSMLAGGVVGTGVGAGAGSLADRNARTKPVTHQVAPTAPETALAPESANEVQAMLDALAKANEVTKDNFTDEEAISQPMEAPVDITPPPPPVDEQADPQAELDAQVNAGTVEEPPTPEAPDQIAAQLEATLDPESTKAVTLVTPGEELPPIPEGLEVGEPTEAGIPIFNPEKITPKLVTESGQGDVYDPEVLGLGAEVAQSDTAVTTSTPEGTPVLEELVTPETVDAAIESQQAAVPGGVTEVKPAAQVVAKRKEDTTPTPTTVDEAAKWLTAREPGMFSERGSATSARKVYEAIETGVYGDILHPDNKHSRALFQKVTGIKLPPTAKGTKAAFTGKPFPISSAPQASTTPAPEAPTQGQPTPTPPGSAPSPDAGKQGVGVQSQIKWGEITNEEEKGKQQGQVPVVPKPARQLASDQNRGPVTDASERGKLTTEEFVELNELRITREQRGGKLGVLNTERIAELEAKQKGQLAEFKTERSAASKAQEAVETWAKHHEDVIKPAREAVKRAEQFANEMAQDARRTKPETKAKERITKKAFLLKYGVKSMDEANEVYKARIKEWKAKEDALEKANAKGAELEKAKEWASKVWVNEANKRKSSAERALDVLAAIEKKIDSNTYSDPLLLTVFAKLAIKLARQLIKGGMAINQAIRQAVADARKQMPDAPDDDAAVASALQTAIDKEELGMRRGGVKTKRGQVMDTVEARPGLTPETQADAIALTQSVIQESGLKASQLPGENLFRPSADFEQEIEGRKFLEIMKREMERATLDGRQERLSNLINSVREHFAESQAFSPSLQSDLYLAGQSKASELGRGLGALAMDAKELGKVARNIRGELTRILFSRFNGETIQKLMDRIIVQFRDMFTDAELDQLSSDDPRLAGIMKKIQAASDRDTGGRVYRAVQARLKPKPTLKQGQKERKAREDEAIDQIIENALALGVKEPAPKPGNKLTPDERLGLMTRPATQVKIQEATEKAVAEAEFNAGWKMMEADASSDSEADLAELAELKAAGETPDDDAIERGLALPEFAHWKTIRDGFLNYSPTTLKLVREVIKGRFKGTKFDDPKVSKPETRIDLNALAREPDAEVDRTIAAQLAAVGAIMEVNGATPETKARVLKMVQQDIAAQVQIARGRIVDGFLSPAERTAPKSASQKLRELLNAGLTKDPRYQSQKTRDLLKRVVDSITTADQFAGMAGQPRASKLSFMEAKLAQAVAAEPSLDDWMKAAVWTRLTERMLDAESSLATRLAGGKDVSFEARAAQTPEEREAAHRKSVNRLTEGVRAGLLDQRIVDEVSQKSVFQRLTPTLRDLVRTVMETPVSGQAGLAKAFSNVIVSQMAIDPALADKVGAGLAQAYAAKFKAARGRALTQALATLTPKERREFNPGKPLFRAIQNAVNAGGFDTSSALQQIAKDHKWNIPSDAEVAKIRALAEEEQRLRGDNDEKAAATLPARSRLISEMRTRWARMSNPFSDRTVRAEAAGELMSANLLLRMAFATKQVLDVGTQLFYDTGTRAYAAAAELYENDKSEGRETRFWKDMSSALKDATESRLGSVKMALSEAKGALKGQTGRDQALGITSEVRLLERMVLRANEAEADGEHVKAFALRLVAALRFSFRVASSMDAFQGVGVEQQSMREQVIAGLRDQGKTPEEASKIAKTVMGDMASEFALAQATVSLDPDVSEADRSAAAWNVVKARQYARMASAQLDVEGFQKTNETLRSLVGWNLPETGGPGMILAAPMGWANTLMKEAGIPYRLPFANAIATGVNRATTFAGGGFIPSMYGTSPWFATPKDRIQRKAEAAVGLSLMSAVGFAALAGLIQAFTDWPDDPDERNLWEREGHRPNTVEFHYGDGKFLRLSMNTGPVAILRPMLAGIAAAQQLARKREKQNEAGRKKADKDGTEFTPVPLATEDVMIAAAWAAWNGIFRTRTTAGMVGSGADYSTFSPKKTLVSAAGSLIPFAPLAREAGMLAGANVDPKKADVVDLLLPTPGSGAARRNFLGDPVGTPRAAERIASILTGGTAIAGGKDEPAYRLLKETGWRPQTPSATRLWTIGDKLRALTPEEYATFEKVRGTTLKAGLNEIANRGVTGKDALDEIKQVDKEAVQAAKEAVGVD